MRFIRELGRDLLGCWGGVREGVPVALDMWKIENT